jgi:integrase
MPHLKRKIKGRRYSARDASGKLVQRTFASAKDGREWQLQIRRDRDRIRAGLDIERKIEPITVSAYAERYLDRREKGQVIGKHRGKRRHPAVRGTFKSESQRIHDYIVPRVGNRPLAAIESDEWESIFDDIQRNPVHEKLKGGILSDATINKIRALMSRLYEDAMVEHFACYNPIRETSSRHEGDPEDKSAYWSKEECGRYLTEADKEGPIFFCWAVWALNFGSRVNELLAIQHVDVNLDEGFIQIRKIVDIHDGFAVRERTKGKKSRIVGINQSVRDAYMRLIETTGQVKPFQFVFDRGGRPISYFYFYKLHREVCRRAKVKVIRVHDMRHTFASQFVMSGGSLENLAKILGHTNLTTTSRYAKFLPKHLIKEAFRVEIGIKPSQEERKSTDEEKNTMR